MIFVCYNSWEHPTQLRSYTSNAKYNKEIGKIYAAVLVYRTSTLEMTKEEAEDTKFRFWEEGPFIHHYTFIKLHTPFDVLEMQRKRTDTVIGQNQWVLRPPYLDEFWKIVENDPYFQREIGSLICNQVDMDTDIYYHQGMVFYCCINSVLYKILFE